MDLRGSESLKREVGTVRRARRIPRRVTAEEAPAGPLLELDDTDAANFEATVRGSRFCDVEDVVVGETLRCERQPANPADPHAVALHRTDPSSTRVGYLPREVSVRLAPFLDADQLSLSAIVIDRPKTRTGQRGITIQIRPQKEWESVREEETSIAIDKAIVQARDASERSSFSNRILSENVVVMLKNVRMHYESVLTHEERTIYTGLTGMRASSVALLMRLYVRKGRWFRIRELEYFDNETMHCCLKELLTSGLLLCSDALSAEKRRIVLSSTLNVNEIKEFLRQLRNQNIGCRLTGNKRKLNGELMKILDQNPRWVESLMTITGPCISVADSVNKALKTAEHLFFLNASQDVTSFLLQELDIIKWPQYEQRIMHPVFHDRAAFDGYTDALQSASSLETAIQNGSSEEIETCLKPVWMALERNQHKMMWTSNGSSDALPNDPVSSGISVPLFLARFSSNWVHAMMVTVGVSYLEKQKRYSEAIEKLRMVLGGNACPARRGMWWNRLIVDLQHLKRFNAALETCTSALADPWVRHGNRAAIKRQVVRLSKPPRKWKVPEWATLANKEPKLVKIHAKPLNSEQGFKSQFIGKSGEVTNVEQLALEYYEEDRNGVWSGIHTEGSLWHTLFGILFWDVIFSIRHPLRPEPSPSTVVDVEDVFRSPFQSAPLDFGTDAFYFARHELIRATLDGIEQGGFCDLFSRNWNTHFGEMCRGVQWDRYPLEQCSEAMECVGGRRLASMCRLLAEDYKAVSGGLPDLFLWSMERHDCKLVEVKGPNDRLSDQQRAWIAALTEIGFSVEVFKVVTK